MKYILKLPVYQYNTGRADNGNTIFEHTYETKKDVHVDLEFVNTCFHKIKNDIELEEQEYERYHNFFILPGFQIEEAYVTIRTEINIQYNYKP